MTERELPFSDADRGAIEIARYWIREPGEMVNAGFENICRELYTVSRALAALARRIEDDE